jgi:hypothetical protein
VSQRKDSNPPKSPHPDDIHVTPPEGLKDALEGEESEELAKKGRAALEKAVTSMNPSSAPPARSEGGEGDDEDEDDGDRDSLVDIDETGEDLVAATGAFAAGVDTITNALLVLLGKYEESGRRLAFVSRALVLCVFVSVLAFGGVGYMVYRTEKVIADMAVDRQDMNAMAKNISEATKTLADLTKKLKETDKKVEEVKKVQEEQPAVSIEPDGKGGAKVVVKAKECKGDAKDCEKPVPAPKPTGKKPPVPPSTAKIEIPIPGATSPKQPSPDKPQGQMPAYPQ